MKILLIMNANNTHYSGGRYVALYLANLMAHCKTDVTVWAPQESVFVREFDHLATADTKLTYIFGENGKICDDTWDVVFVVPDQSPNTPVWKLSAKLLSEGKNNPLPIFLNFESENWFNQLVFKKKDPRLW